MVFESFTGDFFENVDLDYNILNTHVYDNLLKESYKQKRPEKDPQLLPLPKSTVESFIDGSEPVVPVKLEPELSNINTINIGKNNSVSTRLWGLSDEMILLMSLIVLVIYSYFALSKKIDRLFYNQMVMNSNVIKNSSQALSSPNGEVILPKMT